MGSAMGRPSHFPCAGPWRVTRVLVEASSRRATPRASSTRDDQFEDAQGVALRLPDVSRVANERTACRCGMRQSRDPAIIPAAAGPMLFQGFTRNRRGSGTMEDTADTPSTLDLAGLESALRQSEPAAMLLPSWLLEKIIAADHEIRAPLFSIPHDRSHVIARERLMQLVADEELPLPADPPDEPT